MVHGAWGQSSAHEPWQYVPATYMPEPPINESQQFYKMLEVSKSDLWAGCDYSELSTNARLMTMKSEHRLSQRVVDELCQFMEERLSKPNRMPNGCYKCKKQMQALDMPHAQTSGEMCHPSVSAAWKTFDKTHPIFASESRNASPKNPKRKIDVFLQPLIAELKDLWTEGIPVYDISRKQNFQLHAALMWTISDFPAYSIVFDEGAETANSELKGKTKGNANARRDLEELGIRLELWPYGGKYHKANFTLDKESMNLLLKWLNILKFSDGYVSNLSRCIDMKKHKLYGMKSHDCHVFMQRLLPIGLRELLPHTVWEPLTELSNFFRDLTATVIREVDMTKYSESIVVTLCKLEMIFLPSFFDSMEHLLVHLAYEALIAGPMHFRWMYPFERYMRKLKLNVKNNVAVEASICNAYLTEEASHFCPHYFESDVRCRGRDVPRHDDGGGSTHPKDMLQIFTYDTICVGKGRTRFLLEAEYKAAHTYILLNTQEAKEFEHMFIKQLRESYPGITLPQIEQQLENHYALWFNEYGQNNLPRDSHLYYLSQGPLTEVTSYNVCIVNGYKFRIDSYGKSKSTVNSGVCIRGSNYNYDEDDSYGILKEGVEVEYCARPIKKVVLFNCGWFDLTPHPRGGTIVHPKYKIVEVNTLKEYPKYDPFVLAKQASQVYFVPFPSKKKDKENWRAVLKVRAKKFDSSYTTMKEAEEHAAFQEDEVEVHEISDDERFIHPARGMMNIIALNSNTSGREVDEPLDVPNLTCDGYDGSDNGDGAGGSDNCDGADNVGGADDSDCDGSDGSQPSDFDYSAESCEDSTDDEALDMMVEKYVQPSVRGEQLFPTMCLKGYHFFDHCHVKAAEERRYWTARRELEKVSPEALRYLETTIDRSQWTMAHDEFRRWDAFDTVGLGVISEE
ncbi:hypothetical protein SASPL_157230 [Salvia splendens]|uniref:DUF4218 domain-containing protein n=1 Tax=Salvia splendens TaxID=180675 RepID=A0A8X8VVD6_SALSN|nr:hypothetical protein SASPL_157230 [Salvia splendens]